MRRVVWVIINSIQALFTACWTLLWILVSLFAVFVFKARKTCFKLGRGIWAPGLLMGAGARVEVMGLERLGRDKTYFFAANHQSMIDIPVLMRALPHDLHFVVKKELSKVPFLGSYIRIMGMIFVSRTNVKESVADMSGAGALMMSGRSVLCFPEGTRSRNGELKKLKKGAFGPALMSGIPVVPVAIQGSRHVLPADGFKVRPGLIQVVIGDAISTDGLAMNDRARISETVMRSLKDLLDSL